MEPRRWLRVAEVAELLAVHQTTIRKMISRRELPFVKRKGVGVRVDWKEYERQLERDTIKSGSR